MLFFVMVKTRTVCFAVIAHVCPSARLLVRGGYVFRSLQVTYTQHVHSITVLCEPLKEKISVLLN
jgi:hypothetical protein